MANNMYANSRWALGKCDRCGFTYKLRELRAEVYNGRLNGLRVCPECFDKDHPQLQAGRINVNDPQSLRDPRPDSDEVGSTGLFGWTPVGHPQLKLTGGIGTVTVSIV